MPRMAGCSMTHAAMSTSTYTPPPTSTAMSGLTCPLGSGLCGALTWSLPLT